MLARFAADLISVDRDPHISCLIERSPELRVLTRAAHQAAAGRGGVTVIEAPAGSGKSALLAAAGETGRAAGLRIMSAAAIDPRRDVPFALALRLFEPLWDHAAGAGAPKTFAGPLQLAAALLRSRDVDPSPPAVPATEFAVTQGLLHVVRQLATETNGLALLVDDLRWADGASLRLLAELADRAGELPVALTLAFRPGHRSADPRAMGMIRRAAVGAHLQPDALTGESVAEFIRRRLPEATPAFITACGRATAGNPGLLAHLVDACADQALSPTAENAFGVDQLVPAGLAQALAAELEAITEPERRIAHAVAILGPGATVREIARHAGLEAEEVLETAPRLAGNGILASGAIDMLAAPILRPALLASLEAGDRARAHLRAARVLTEESADATRISEHLLQAPADRCGDVIPVLREAAARALESRAPERTVALLHRALAENPPTELRADILADLGAAEAQADGAGAADAADRLAEARRITDDPGRAVQLALAEGQILYDQGAHGEAAHRLELALRELVEADAALGFELTSAYIANASLVPELYGRALELRERMLGTLPPDPSPRQRAALAHTVVLDGLLGAPRTHVRQLAEVAWGDGALPTGEGLDLAAPLLCLGLVFADELERAVELADRMLERVPPQHQGRVEQAITCVRAWAHYHQGSIGAAEADANLALSIDPDVDTSYAGYALAVIACCQIQRGQADLAAAGLAQLQTLTERDPLTRALVLDIRAQVRLAEHAPQRALDDIMQAGALLEERFSAVSPGVIPWRSRAALAQLSLGQPTEARALAEAELASARSAGLATLVIRTLRVIGLAQHTRGLAKLAEAVAVGDDQPPRMEHIRALIDYGAALRRRNRRAEARGPLRRGLDLSHRGGIAVLEARAQTELVATGARPRRAAATGLESLTISQRRVAELAARGLTTREIAEALFIRPKTVEFHLRQTYMKLDVSDRQGLTEVVMAA